MKTVVIIPVYNGLVHLKTLLGELSARTPGDDVGFIVVDDASTEDGVSDALQAFAAGDARVKLVTNKANLGFVKSVNHALRLAEGCHCVLLNSDTQVPHGWLGRLIKPILDDPKVASVTPCSNGATIFSVPIVNSDNREMIRRFTVDQLDEIVSSLDLPAEYRECPTGHGFCMAMNAAALKRVGILDEDTFGRGYGEEVDWCLRASLAGFRHVVAADLFVAHHHCGSFLPEEKARLSRANGDVILKKYPFYADIVKAHRETGNGIKWKEHVGDPLFERLAEEWNGKGRPAKRALLVGLGMAKSDASEALLSQARHLTDAGYLVDVAYMRPGSLLRDFAALGCRTRAVDPDKAADAGAYEDIRRVHYGIVICSTMRLYKVATELRLSKDLMWFLREIANPEQVAEHVEKLERLKKRLSRAEQEIADMKASFAYRTGMALTWPLRKMYGLARKR